MRILTIIKKNLKFLLRAKASSLIIIYGPLLLMFLVGVAFDNSQYQSVTIGAYSEEYSELSENFIEHINDAQFNTIKISSEDLCINKIKTGELQMCNVFPKDMKLKNNISNEVVFHVDYAKINLVWIVMDMVSDSLFEKSREISVDLTKIIVNQLQLTNKVLKENKQIINNLITSSNKEIEEINNVYSTLDIIDISLNLAKFPTNTMNSQKGSINIHVNNLNDNFKALVDEVDDAEDSITSNANDIMIDKTNTSADYNTALNIFETADDLDSFASNKNKDRSNSHDALESAITTLKQSIDTTDANLKLLDDKLSKATQKKLQSSIRLKQIEKQIEDDSNNLVSLKTSIDNLTKGIESVEVTTPETIVSPIKTKINPIVAEKTHLNYLFPSLIVVLIMFVGVLVGSTIVMMEKQSSAHFRNLISPVSRVLFLISNYLTTLFLLFIQILLIIFISSFFFKTQVFDQFFILLLYFFLISTFFIAFGLLIGEIFKTEETITIASIVAVTLMLLLSDLILPLESMSMFLMKIASFNPFILSSFLMKQSLIYNASLSSSFTNMIYLIIAILVIVIINIIIIKKKEWNMIGKKLFGKK